MFTPVENRNNYQLSLMNEGRTDRSNFEKVADCILTLPRKLWLGKSVTLIPNSTPGQTEDVDGKPTPRLVHQSSQTITQNIYKPVNLTFGPSTCTRITAAVKYALVSLIAYPLFVIGGGLKIIAIKLDPAAFQFHELVRSQLKLEALQKTLQFINDALDFIKSEKSNPLYEQGEQSMQYQDDRVTQIEKVIEKQKSMIQEALNEARN